MRAETRPLRLSERLGHTVVGVPRRLRRAAAENRAALRAARPRTVVVESLLFALAGAFALVPLLLVPPERLVWAVLEGVWAALLVPVRRARPGAAVLGSALLVVGDNVWTLAVAPLIVLSATRRLAPPRRAWLTVGAACAVVGVLTVVRDLVRPEEPPLAAPLALIGNAVSVVLLLLLPALAGTLLGRRRLLVNLLRERNAYLEQARTLTAVAARMEERNRIAGEMHDLLGHRLSLISVHAGALELAVARKAPALAEQAELLRTTAGTAMEELRDILDVLRHEDMPDPMDGTGDDRGTHDDITALVKESQRAGSTVQLEWSVPDRVEMGPRTRQAIHRVVREGLTNVLKHASGAPTRVAVKGGHTWIEVSVTNEAPHAAGPSRGGNRSGLAGCQERISLLGGTFEAGTLANGGFRMAAWLPAHGNGPPEAIARPRASAAPLADTARHRSDGTAYAHSDGTAYAPSDGTAYAPSDGNVRKGARAPLPDEVLTWPRVLGSGCVALLVVLPTVAFLVVLLAEAALR
ncbi:histidine kinase [Streptomyces sp. NPDC001508]|uniref:sensor histidine kinase n=1 Tax=Streptomyces sp. NPDC001508 TaxID=3154656 RepID=UPI00331FF1D8